jgi:hypothetical protein
MKPRSIRGWVIVICGMPFFTGRWAVPVSVGKVYDYRKWHERSERLENEQRLSSRDLPQTVFWTYSKIGNETKHVPSKEKAQWRVQRICGVWRGQKNLQRNKPRSI